MRAYSSITEPDIRRSMQVQIVGLWILSACFVVSGVIGGSALLTLFGQSFSQTLAFVSSSRRGGPGSAVARLYARLWKAFVGECVFVIAGAPVAALVSLHLPLPEQITTRFISDALVLPVAAIIVLVFLVRRRPRA